MPDSSNELRVVAETSPTIDRRTFVGAASLAALATLRAPERLARSLRSTHTTSKLADVNTTDIRSAIELGCRSMASLANADDRVVGSSHFALVLRPIAMLGFSEIFSDAQVPGRHLNALLTAEGRLGVTIDQSTIERLTRVVFFSYSGPVALPLNRKTLDGKLVNFAPVNIAHGFHALYALAAYRHSAQALELAEKSIAAVHSLWKSSSGWDRTRLENDLGLTYIDPFPEAPFIAGIAMAIGPLSKLYRATGSRAALALATELKDKALAEYFLASGEHDEERFGVHVHNVVYVMASLAWFATITGDAAVMDRVKSFYDNGLTKLRDAIGWSAEFSGLAPAGPNQSANGDRGESGNSALILETALLLGRAGYPEYFADAELMLRSHLLPSQLRDVSFMAPERNPNNVDRFRDVARRVKGAWGMSAPYGQLPFATRILYSGTDTVGTVVAALCEALAQVATFEAGQHVISLLFDIANANVEIRSRYSSDGLHVVLKRPGAVSIRIPPWLRAEQIELTGAARQPLALRNGYLHLDAPPTGAFTLRFALPVRDINLVHQSATIRARLRGDEVIAMDNRGTDATYFDPLPA